MSKARQEPLPISKGSLEWVFLGSLNRLAKGSNLQTYSPVIRAWAGIHEAVGLRVCVFPHPGVEQGRYGFWRAAIAWIPVFAEMTP